MSGLAAVLAGRHTDGVFRWHASFPAADVQHTVEHAGWRFGYVDGWGTESKAEFLAAIGAALNFPEHYGNNFDALADCLSDVRDDGGVLFLWDGWGPFAHADLPAFKVALGVLPRDASRSFARLEPYGPGILMAVLLLSYITLFGFDLWDVLGPLVRGASLLIVGRPL